MEVNPETLNDIRRRVLEGTHVDEEELAFYVKSMISKRVEQAQAPKAKAKAAKTKLPPGALDDLLPKKS